MLQWALPLAAFGATYLIASGGRASPGYTPPPATSAGKRQLRAYLDSVEPYIPGFRDFALAASLRESGWNSNAINDSPGESKASARGFRNALERGHFKNSPYKNSPDLWGFGSGGWFGFLPSTGLSRGGRGGPFENEHPNLVFDPAASVAMAATLVRDLVRNYFDRLPPAHRNWYAIRRGWASPGLVADYKLTKPRSQASARRLRKDMSRALGVSESRADQLLRRPVQFRDWPGGGVVWGMLANREPTV